MSRTYGQNSYQLQLLEIMKSRLPSGAWKSIKSMTAAERSSVKDSLGSGVRRGRSEYTLAPKRRNANKLADTRQYYAGLKESVNSGTKGPKSGFHNMTSGNPLMGGAAAITGSKKNGKKVLIRNKTVERLMPGQRFMEHEAEHLRPKRTGWRLAEVMEDSKKLGREEARADWFSGNARHDKFLRSKGSAYASQARKVRRGGKMTNKYGVGPNPNQFNRTYTDTQDLFRDKGVKFGARRESNRKWVQDNFGQKRVSQVPLAVGAAGVTGLGGASAYNSAKDNKRKRAAYRERGII